MGRSFHKTGIAAWARHKLFESYLATSSPIPPNDKQTVNILRRVVEPA